MRVSGVREAWNDPKRAPSFRAPRLLLGSDGMADWVTISSLSTAGGTLVLAGATFASVRSANRAARVAERSLLAGLQPLLVPSHLSDEAQKVHFADGRVVVTPGGSAAAEVGGEAVYL